MLWKILILHYYLNCCALVLVQSTASPTYSAGVVEYQRISDPISAVAETDLNLNEFLSIIIKTDVDILVFPESSLNKLETAIYVPEAADGATPCRNTSFSDILQKLSCAASGTQKYIVVNVKEKSDCPDKEQIENEDPRPCTNNKMNIYNTNVVLDRNGMIVSKYRKYNLFGENGLMRPLHPKVATFTTDFGVTFGHFICFDLMFDRPALDIVNQGVRDIIFTANWFSELPFLTAVQIQQAWAHTHNVNLLAAGGNNPSIGSTGSGIYHGQYGPLTAGMYPVGTRTVLTAVLPKLPYATPLTATPVATPIPRFTHHEMLNIYLKRENIDHYTSKSVHVPENDDAEDFELKLCHNLFCCEFIFNITLLPVPLGKAAYQYRAAVYSGQRTFDGYANGTIQLCSIFACTDNTLGSCGQRFDNLTDLAEGMRFNFIKIKTQVNEHSPELIVPSTLDTSLLPLNPAELNYTVSIDVDYDEKTVEREITLTLLNPRSDLLTFAIWARDYQDKSSAISVMCNVYLLLLTFIVKLF